MKWKPLPIFYLFPESSFLKYYESQFTLYFKFLVNIKISLHFAYTMYKKVYIYKN